MSETTTDREPKAAARKAAAELTDPGDSTITGARIAFLTAISLAFVILADWLFWDHPRGWTIGGFGLLLIGTILTWERALPRGRAVLLVMSAVVILCLQCLEEPNRLTVVCGLLGLGTLAIVLREGWSASAVTWAHRWALLAVTWWQSLFKDVASWYRSRQTNGGLPRSGARLLCNWSIPILLSVIFLKLFAVANPVISSWLREAWQGVRTMFRQLVEQSPSGWRLLMWLLVGLGVWALLRFRSNIRASAHKDGASENLAWAGSPSPAFVVRCLVLFNALFAFQTLLDLYYLWCGGELPTGLTHAQYAHRGAYPLLAAAILAAVFVLAAFRGGPREQKMRLARRLVCVWLIQNLFLVVSAAWRLRLYVEVYTLTRWRVAAAVWMLLVLCGLVWILLRVIGGRSNHWLVNVNTITALVVFYVCSFGNFDGWIAGFNVAHCQEVQGSGPSIDLAYLESLGPDTLPALLQLADKLQDAPKASRAKETIKRLKADLQANLGSWRGWTWRRHRLLRLAAPRDSGGLDAPS